MKSERELLFEEWAEMSLLFRDLGDIAQNPGKVGPDDVRAWETWLDDWSAEAGALAARVKAHLLSGKEQ